jgi:hypothetical protein
LTGEGRDDIFRALLDETPFTSCTHNVMKRHLLTIAIMLGGCAAILHSQSPATYPRTMYVIYDGAPVYDSANHMSSVLGELRLGDSIRVLGVAGKFYRVGHGEREGFLYWSNIAPERPKGKAKGKNGTGSRTKKEKKGKREKKEAADTGPASELSDSTPSGEALPSSRDSASAVSSGTEADRPRADHSKGVRCRAITKAGRQCSRTATDPSGYCWQHGK